MRDAFQISDRVRLMATIVAVAAAYYLARQTRTEAGAGPFQASPRCGRLPVLHSRYS
jgi:hypothetical protein